MANILALESSGAICSACLISSGKIRTKYADMNGNTHDRLLAEFIRRILEDNKMKVENLDAVAVSAGPGSFTGLRIGASLAKALCFDNQPKLISVPTLNAIAFAAKEMANSNNFNKIAATIQSYKDQFYLQYFDLDLNPISEITIEQVFEYQFNDEYYYAGYIKNEKQNHINKYEQALDSEVIAHFAEEIFDKNEFIKSEEFTPLYVAEFVVKQGNKI